MNQKNYDNADQDNLLDLLAKKSINDNEIKDKLLKSYKNIAKKTPNGGTDDILPILCNQLYIDLIGINGMHNFTDNNYKQIMQNINKVKFENILIDQDNVDDDSEAHQTKIRNLASLSRIQDLLKILIPQLYHLNVLREEIVKLKNSKIIPEEYQNILKKLEKILTSLGKEKEKGQVIGEDIGFNEKKLEDFVTVLDQEIASIIEIDKLTEENACKKIAPIYYGLKISQLEKKLISLKTYDTKQHTQNFNIIKNLKTEATHFYEQDKSSIFIKDSYKSFCNVADEKADNIQKALKKIKFVAKKQHPSHELKFNRKAKAIKLASFFLASGAGALLFTNPIAIIACGLVGMILSVAAVGFFSNKVRSQPHYNNRNMVREENGLNL